MDEVRLKNFRCFRDEQTARLAPLTLLVGENSTGKTSFLALIRALWDAAYGQVTPNFKEPPYDLGSFDEVVHHRAGRAGRLSAFTAGFAAGPQPPRPGSHGRSRYDPHRFEITFSRGETVPAPSRVSFAGDDDVAFTDAAELESSRTLHLRTRRGEWRLPVPAEIVSPLGDIGGATSRIHYYSMLARAARDVEPVADSPDFTADDRERLEELLQVFVAFLDQRPYASAPVRSRPRRTYDFAYTRHDPEGETTPMYLSTLFFSNREAWTALKEALERFGREAGLFDEITVRALGRLVTEPYQVHVRRFGRRAKGPPRNLIDVGYGVSQVLPVITELFRDSETPLFLLQQPEVHLHPQAQAALGSLFCEIAGPRRQLVVETHSDHLLDRVRMDVRDAKTELKPDDVSILFFERGDLDVRIHSLRLDGEGNVLDAPPSYRRFFMEETRRSLRL